MYSPSPRASPTIPGSRLISRPEKRTVERSETRLTRDQISLREDDGKKTPGKSDTPKDVQPRASDVLRFSKDVPDDPR